MSFLWSKTTLITGSAVRGTRMWQLFFFCGSLLFVTIMHNVTLQFYYSLSKIQYTFSLIDSPIDQRHEWRPCDITGSIEKTRNIERKFKFLYEVAFMQVQNWASQLIFLVFLPEQCHLFSRNLAYRHPHTADTYVFKIL